MKRNPIKKVGKNARGKELRDITPYLCERAGGMWCGWTAPVKCNGATCEWPDCCESQGLERAHINGRKSKKDDNVWNLAILCKAHHDELDHGTEKRREYMRETLTKLVRERNEAHGIGGKHD